ncbi:MAG: M42 family metallopeptidase [Symbiobacteriaceae bacterium]|nr:M42 family metallopeptidase [Symbiobacteriaceae bacterium]
MKELLRQLMAIPAACGREQEIIRFLYNRMKEQVDECYVDGIGNLILRQKGKLPGPVLYLSAHTDEVGLIVKKIEKSGLLRFEKLGGNDDRNLLLAQVWVNTESGQLPGIIGGLSAHMRQFDRGDLVRQTKDLYIDIGAKDEESALKMGVQPGDTVTWASEFKEFGDNRAMGHAFDDRAGCAILVKALEELDFAKVSGEVYGVFSVQEELGIRGARVASHQIHADVAIALDATVVSDTPERVLDNALVLGNGPAIKVLDNRLISSLEVVKGLRRVAKENNIPHQYEIFSGIGTDAGEMHLSHAGVPTGVISIPSRYSHSPYEVIDLGDLHYAKDLLVAFIYSMKNKDEFSFLKHS